MPETEKTTTNSKQNPRPMARLRRTTTTAVVSASALAAAISENERRERQLSALYELGRAVSHTDTSRLLQMIAERAVAAMDAHTCSLLLRERGGDMLRVAASVGLPHDVAESVTMLVGERIAGRVAATGQPILVNKDPNNHPMFSANQEAPRPIAARPEVESALCAPLVAADGLVLGVLCLSRHAPALSFTEGDLRVLTLFAAEAGSVIAQTRLRAELTRRRQELTALSQIAELIRAQVSEETLHWHLARCLPEWTGLGRCQVWQGVTTAAEGRFFLLLASHGFEEAEPLLLPSTLGTLEMTYILPEELETDSAAFRDSLRIMPGCLAIAPVRVRGVNETILIGDVGSGDKSEGVLLREERAETLTHIAAHISVALENTRLFAERERAANERARLEREMAHTAHLASLGRLSATVAHELRNPLSSIKGAAQFLLREFDGAEKDDTQAQTVCDFLTIVVDEVDSLSALTTDLLEFARPVPVQRRPCDLIAVVRQEIAFLRGELETRGVREITEVYGATLVAVDADPLQIGQALRNLLLNAAQASTLEGAEGHITVTVAQQGDRVELRVEDNGTGIPTEVLERIGEPFYTTKAQGTGLGLTRVRQVMEAHGGTLHMGNRENGLGACFILGLPSGTLPVGDNEEDLDGE